MASNVQLETPKKECRTWTTTDSKLHDPTVCENADQGLPIKLTAFLQACKYNEFLEQINNCISKREDLFLNEKYTRELTGVETHFRYIFKLRGLLHIFYNTDLNTLLEVKYEEDIDPNNKVRNNNTIVFIVYYKDELKKTIEKYSSLTYYNTHETDIVKKEYAQFENYVSAEIMKRDKQQADKLYNKVGKHELSPSQVKVYEQLFMGKDHKLNLERPLKFPAGIGPNAKQRPTPQPIVYLPTSSSSQPSTSERPKYIPPHMRGVTSKNGGKRNRKTLRRRKMNRHMHRFNFIKK